MRNIRLFIGAFTLLTLFYSCTEDRLEYPEFDLENAGIHDMDDYSVYQTVLGGYSFSKLIVKQQSSIILPSPSDIQWFLNSNALKGMEKELFQKFIVENAIAANLDQDKLNFQKEVHLISNSEYSYIFGNDDHKAWGIMQDHFDAPDGYHTVFNRIAFNVDRNQALVGGQDYYFLMVDGKRQTKKMGWVNYLEKEHNEWIIMGRGTYVFD